MAILRMAVQGQGHAVLAHQVRQCGDIDHMGQIAEGQGLIAEQGGDHQGQGRVFRAADGDDALERVAAADANTFHGDDLMLDDCGGNPASAHA